MAIRQHLWTVEPKPHKTWPDPSKVIQKWKHSKTTDTMTQQERSSTTPWESLKKYRHLKLWEAPQSIEASNSTILKDINAALTASSTEEDNNMAQKEQTTQVQWLHRWFDESTQEDLTHLPEVDTWTGSPILRSLAKRKQQEHRHSRWSDRRQAPLELSTEFPTMYLSQTLHSTRYCNGSPELQRKNATSRFSSNSNIPRKNTIDI
jgi:hypothetical protein